MIDIQSTRDNRGVPLHCVGVKDYTLQIKVNEQHTLAKISLGVSLTADQKGIHMSRLCKLLNSFKILTNKNVFEILTSATNLLTSDSAMINIHTTYFRKKEAPISSLSGMMNYEIYVDASTTKTKQVIKHIISIPVTSVCPCSKAISNYGAHNQRGLVRVSLSNIDVSDYDNIIDIVEKKAASCELYGVLKREDEKVVTEFAYNNAKFVEDIVRDAVISLRTIYGHKLSSVECINDESIHNHNAFAFFDNKLEQTF